MPENLQEHPDADGLEHVLTEYWWFKQANKWAQRCL